uniref:F-box domain-containing protein n=1 Tax=Globodera rostochiensis TaxID=31243 RepID=A0A914GTX7_GLORO
MALTLPLHFFDGIRRLLPSRVSSRPSTSEQYRLASHIIAHCSIFDQIRWRRVSKGFKQAIDARINKFTRVDVRCYPGLAQLSEESGGGKDAFEWHPRATLMVLEMGPNELGIAVDVKMKAEDVKALVQLLYTFRCSIEQLCMDSPIIELLVSQINRQQMNILLDLLKSSRTVCSPTKRMNEQQRGGTELVSLNHLQDIPYGPFFPNLKKLTITSQSNQLEHLSRLLSYAVGVDFLYETSNIDLLCLKICIANGRWSQKPHIRLFRHVTRFRQWTEAGEAKWRRECDESSALLDGFCSSGVADISSINRKSRVAQWLCMPATISVSPAIPDKLVVNGVDLLNRDELSASQNRELQRYIDANAHLLGFLDKDKDQQQQADGGDNKRTSLAVSVPANKFDSLSTGQTAVRPTSYDSSSFSSPAYGRPPSASASLNRTGSPYSMGGGSEYGGGSGRRKGVSWSDVVEEPRPTRTRSNSPPPASFIRHPMPVFDNGSPLEKSDYETGQQRYGKNLSDDSEQNGLGHQNYNRHRHTSQNPFERADGWGSSNPWTGSLDHRGGGSREREHRALGRRGHRAYGDHRVSGIEMKPKGWTGGEIVTDRNIMNKSLKPRRFYYSPIGDGVVAADGIEMKRPPPDLTPRRYEYHQRYVEHGPGQPGVRVTEKVWHEGELGDGRAEEIGRGPPAGWPSNGLGRGRGGPRDDGKDRGAGDGPKWPGLDDDDGRRMARKVPLTEDDGQKGPSADGGRSSGNGGLGRFPLLDYGEGKMPRGGDDDDGTRGRTLSAPSVGSDGAPREGWTKEFITNPRELINQYGTETLTTIFDYEDHTPKTYISMKESWSPAPPNLPAEVEEVQ